jgi:hypothetical protein
VEQSHAKHTHSTSIQQYIWLPENCVTRLSDAKRSSINTWKTEQIIRTRVGVGRGSSSQLSSFIDPARADAPYARHASARSAPRARGRAVRIPARGTEKAMHSLSIPGSGPSRQPVRVVGRHWRRAAAERRSRPCARREDHDTARARAQRSAGESHPARCNNGA